LGFSLHPNAMLQDDLHFVDALTGRPVDLTCDEIALVGMRQPEDQLFDDLQSKPVGEIHRIGDCLVPGTIQAAVLSGHTVAKEILEGPSVPLREQVVVG